MFGCADRHRILSLQRQGRLWLDRLATAKDAKGHAENKKVKPGFLVNSGFTFLDRHGELGPTPLVPVTRYASL